MHNFQTNLQKAKSYIERFEKNTTGHYINGEFVIPSTAKLFTNTNPHDGNKLGDVVSGTEHDIDQACEAARNAFADWRDMPGAQRKKILHKFADNIEKRAEELSLVESVDCGQVVKFTGKLAVRGAANFRFFADKAPEAQNGLALYQPEHTNYTMRTPIGPVGVITPWNAPFMLSTWKIAPALAAGCTIVHKPAELSPLTATLLAEIAEQSGLPKGVWNMVNGLGETAGKRLSENPNIKAIAFVGETITGTHILRQGSATMKRVHLELGGKNPVIVFDDADFDRALNAVVFMIYSMNGQRCTSSSRLLIQSGIKDAFLAALEQRVKNIKVGHPLDPASEVGPLIHQEHYNKVMSYMDLAREEGAKIAAGGGSFGESKLGCYVQPTLFTEANNKMRIAREEIFGPVLTAIEFSTEEEAVELANDTDYGLAGYIWTNNASRATRLAKTINAGMLWVNSENNRNLPSPFGGMKMSGIGRDGGDYSFDFYMETKNVCTANGTHNIPVLGANE